MVLPSRATQVSPPGRRKRPPPPSTPLPPLREREPGPGFWWNPYKWAYVQLLSSGDWGRKACLSCQLLEQDFPCDMASLQDTGVSKGVMDFCSYSLGFYNAPLAHNGQVLADLRLTLSCRFDKVFHRSWLFTQQGEEFQACRVGKSLAEVCLQSIQ